MRYCKNCHREIPDDLPFCPYCCPPDANPNDNWAFAPLGDIGYTEDTDDTDNRVTVEQIEDFPHSELSETQQFNMAFDFNDVTLVGEDNSREPVNYIKAVADVTPQSGEAARQKALDEIFNPIERIFSKDDPDAGRTRRPAKRTRSFKISPMKRPGTVPVPAGTTDDGTMHENTEASKTELSDSAKADTVTDEPTAETDRFLPKHI